MIFLGIPVLLNILKSRKFELRKANLNLDVSDTRDKPISCDNLPSKQMKKLLIISVLTLSIGVLSVYSLLFSGQPIYLRIIATVFSVILAQKLNKYWVVWLIIAFIFPYAIIILSVKGLLFCDTYNFLNEEREYDLIFLYQKGFVRAGATGQTITQIYGDIENIIDKKLKVIIDIGTYFVAKGNFQNMATTTKYSFTLLPYSTEKISINAACINANLPIPGDQDRFDGVKKVPEKVSCFLKEARNSKPMVIQAGIWAITDNYSGDEIKFRLVSRDQYGESHQAVSDLEIIEARRILESLNIPNRL